jgi:hypothetical protein
LFLKDLVDLGASIQATAFQKDPSDSPFKLFPAFISFALFPFGPLVITASGYFQSFAQLRDTALEAMIMDKRIDQRRSLAK